MHGDMVCPRARLATAAGVLVVVCSLNLAVPAAGMFDGLNVGDLLGGLGLGELVYPRPQPICAGGSGRHFFSIHRPS